MKESFGKDQSFTLMKPTWPGITWLKLAGLSRPEVAVRGRGRPLINETNLAGDNMVIRLAGLFLTEVALKGKCKGTFSFNEIYLSGK